MTRSSVTGCGLALAAILLMADGAWGQSGSIPPTWGKPAASTVAPAAAAKPAAATGWEGAAGTSAGQVSPAMPPSQSTVRPAPAALGWARVKPNQPLNAGTLNLSPPGTHASNSRPADSSSTPAQARTVSCQISALHPGWQWMATNHSTQTFVPQETVTFRTHYPYTSPSLPASARDSEDRAILGVPLQPGGSVVLHSINSDLDPMSAPPTCEVESIGTYTVQASNAPPPPPPPTAPAREVSCAMSALNPGWKWTVTNHTNQTFTQHQLFTYKTHYPWANSNRPATSFDSEQRAYLTLPIAPGASAVLMAIHNDLDPMTAPPTCEVETIGDYVVQ